MLQSCLFLICKYVCIFWFHVECLFPLFYDIFWTSFISLISYCCFLWLETVLLLLPIHCQVIIDTRYISEYSFITANICHRFCETGFWVLKVNNWSGNRKVFHPMTSVWKMPWSFFRYLCNAFAFFLFFPQIFELHLDFQ